MHRVRLFAAAKALETMLIISTQGVLVDDKKHISIDLDPTATKNCSLLYKCLLVTLIVFSEEN